MNPRITKRDKALIKGALRRVFARSELHRKVLDSAAIEHCDPNRPRVKAWRQCSTCKKPEAKSYVVVDHVSPVVPVDSALEHMTVQEIADALWCEEKNLAAICPRCHNKKTTVENQERKKNKEARKNK